MRSRHGKRLGAPILAAAIAVAACGDGDGAAADASPARGSRLVVGSSLERWGLLAVPREGGVPLLRSLDSPRDSLWAARTRLPPTAAVHFLDGPSIVLRTPEGGVLRYDADRDRALELGEVGTDARFSAYGGTGIFADTVSGRILEVSRDGAWTHAVPAPLVWAAPLGGTQGVAALVRPEGSDGAALWILRRDEDEPAVRAPVPAAPPGIVTAWGRQLVLAARGEPGVLLLLAASGAPETRARLELGGAVRSLAASPSSHQIYAGTGDPARIVSIDRLDRSHESLAEIPEPPVELRPAWFGGHLLARAGDGAWFVPLAGGPVRRLETEWRPDLPLGLPGDRVLLARGDETLLWAAEEPRAAAPLESPADAWWVPLRWRPGPAPVLAEAGGEAAGGEAAPPADETAAGTEAADAAAGAGEPAAVAGADTAAVDPGEAGDAEGDVPAGEGATLPGADSRPGAEIAAGFYAIVASSQTPDGIRDLAGTLAGAGFPSKIQRHRDEANELWYRALVGPYEDREAAETAARQLRRERGLQVWISEIGPGTRAADFE